MVKIILLFVIFYVIDTQIIVRVIDFIHKKETKKIQKIEFEHIKKVDEFIKENNINSSSN